MIDSAQFELIAHSQLSVDQVDLHGEIFQQLWFYDRQDDHNF